MKKFAIAVLVLVAASIAPAQAANIPVDFGLSLGTYAPTATCALRVSTPASGLDVLDAAVAAGCIDSYDTEVFPGFGKYVSCINDICEQNVSAVAAQGGSYWGFYINGGYASVGVSTYRATSGDELVFAYEGWAWTA